MTITLKTGARNSALSITQTKNTIKELEKVFPSIAWDLNPMSSPGDRDKNSDLKKSEPDFFTRDLDEAVISGEVDCAVHSAKDLPYPLRNELDWFWLPWREDPRDVLIGQVSGEEEQKETNSSQITKSANQQITKLRIGISSERREEYCRDRFPDAELLPIRGNIEERVAQLDEGKYDLLIMAAAGLKRLGMKDRIDEYIPISEMPPPPGQGYIAVTFRAGDKRFETIRELFAKPVVFAGSGPGNPELVTLAAINELKKCEICLYDSLAPDELLQYLPGNAESIYVGKRSGQHSKKQNEICELLAEYARQGKQVLRLKGGDPGVFGRLAEEVDVLDDLSLPFRVVPGISSLNAASAGTGLLLTRRGLSRGFSVMTPRKSGSAEFAGIDGNEYRKFPLAFFMGTSVVKDIIQNLITEGRDANDSASMVFGAGKPEQQIVSGTLSDIAEKLSARKKDSLPGIFLVGENFDSKFIYNDNGALRGRKVLITCSEAIQEKASCEIRRFGGTPIQFPLIQTTLVPIEEFSGLESEPTERLWYLFTSPASVKIFICELRKSKIDVRTLPRIMVCGPGTACEFRKIGIEPDLVASDNYGVEGMLESAKSAINSGDKIIRWCSDKAGKELSCELRKIGCEVEDIVLYKNVPVKYEKLPAFDSVIFASSSAVRSFVDNFGIEALNEKTVSVIGKPTKKILEETDAECKILIANEATISETCSKLAYNIINDELEKFGEI